MADIKLFEYQHKQVRTITIEGQIWFVAKDVCGVLEIVNHKDAVSRLADKMKRVVGVTDPLGQEQKTLVISEAGVYKMAFRSNKPEAERFTDWLATEVIPEIRKTGRYIPKHQGVLPLAAHTQIETQKEMSKSVNSHNYQLGGVQKTIDYNVDNCLAHTGYVPARIKHFGKNVRKLPAKNCSSAKEVLRVTDPEAACCMSLADNLVEQGHEPEKVFKVTASDAAKSVFKGMLELGATPAELSK